VRGVTDEDVQVSELGHRVLHERAAGVRLGEVALERETAAPFSFHRTPRLFRVHMLSREARDRDVGAFAREQYGDGAANS